jgi:hypothetical protein
MTYSLFVDPGVRACGCALYYRHVLLQAKYVRLDSALDDCGELAGPRLWAALAAEVFEWMRGQMVIRGLVVNVVLERPRIYPGSGQQKGDLNDIVDLAGVIGAVAGKFSDDLISHYYPSDWKGQVPKAVMTKRILAALTEQECSRIDRIGAKDHNTIDAVGIGLHHFGRLNKKAIYR